MPQTRFSALHANSPARFTLVERALWPGCIEVEVEGELDLAVSAELASALERAAASEVDVLLDLAGCDFIDLSGVEVLLRGDEQLVARGRRLLLTGVAGQVKRMLSVTGLAGANHGTATPPTRLAAAPRDLPAEERVGGAAR